MYFKLFMGLSVVIAVVSSNICEPYFKKCSNNLQCVHKTLWCNGGNPDCDDGSDEVNCPHEKVESFVEISRRIFKRAAFWEKCKLGFTDDNKNFYCDNCNKIIKKSWVCDGEPDCADESDEAPRWCPSAATTTTTTTTAPPTTTPIPNCPSGWQYLAYTDSCYQFFNTSVTWQTAETQCMNLGAHLAIIQDNQENDFISYLIYQPGSWIGLDYNIGSNSWKWLNETAVTYTNWNTGEPNNIGVENCGLLLAEGSSGFKKWNNRNCQDLRPYTCEFKRKTCLSGWQYFTQTNACYQFFNTSVTWQTAETQCINLGAHLAIIHDSQENDFISYRISQPGAWIGLDYNTGTSSWMWLNETIATYTNWNTDEPNNIGVENCGLLLAEGSSGFKKWNNRNCQDLRPYICKS